MQILNIDQFETRCRPSMGRRCIPDVVLTLFLLACPYGNV